MKTKLLTPPFPTRRSFTLFSLNADWAICGEDNSAIDLTCHPKLAQFFAASITMQDGLIKAQTLLHAARKHNRRTEQSQELEMTLYKALAIVEEALETARGGAK